jgi:hypothetical protein
MWHRKVSKEDRIAVLARDEYACRYCDRDKYNHPRLELHIDHVIAHSRGGSSWIDNLVTACRDCNLKKSDGKALHLLPSRRERREQREHERHDQIISGHNEIISALDQITDHVKPSNVIPFPAPSAKDWNAHQHLGWRCQCPVSDIRPFGAVRCWACGAVRPELTDEAIAEGIKIINRHPWNAPDWQPSAPSVGRVEDTYDPFSDEWMTR